MELLHSQSEQQERSKSWLVCRLFMELQRKRPSPKLAGFVGATPLVRELDLQIDWSCGRIRLRRRWSVWIHSLNSRNVKKASEFVCRLFTELQPKSPSPELAGFVGAISPVRELNLWLEPSCSGIWLRRWWIFWIHSLNSRNVQKASWFVNFSWSCNREMRAQNWRALSAPFCQLESSSCD
jgi:hypothetical protein